MTYAIQTALPASRPFPMFMAPSAMNIWIPVTVDVPKSSPPSLITSVPSAQPNRAQRRS